MNFLRVVSRLTLLLFFLLPVSSVLGEIRVVTTLTVFGDVTKQIGKDRVDVYSVARPRFNPHFIEPKPSDVLKLKRADLFIHGGLDLEAWRSPLVDAASSPEIRPGGTRELDLSVSVPLLEVPTGALTRAAGDIHLFGNPHYTLDPRNILLISKRIAAKLIEVDPEGKAQYEDSLREFDGKLEEGISRWSASAATIRSKNVVAYHKEWEYLANFLGLDVIGYLEPKPGVPPTPQHVVELSHLMAEKRVKFIIQASYFPRDSSSELASKTGAEVKVLCQNVEELPECSDYVSLMDFNVSQLTGAPHA
jgi:zinc/manganese transport system substrate-binding protein